MSITEKNGLKISTKLFDFINNEAIPGTGIKSDNFWNSFGEAVHELAPINKNLIQKREDVQKKIDEWHKKNKGKELNKKEYTDFLRSISYIVEEKKDFNIETTDIDNEISSIAGPQLVVPVDNARYALNAANARWGSLYDALYGTDVISGEKEKEFNKARAEKVIYYVRKFLDEIAPIDQLSWSEISELKIKDKDLIFLDGEDIKYLKNKDQFVAYNGEKENPRNILIKNNNLHIEISFDSNNTVGKIR
jgi:malate synthase